MNDAAAVWEIHPREVSFSHSRDAWLRFSDELETSNDLMWIVLSATSRLDRETASKTLSPRHSTRGSAGTLAWVRRYLSRLQANGAVSPRWV